MGTVIEKLCFGELDSHWHNSPTNELITQELRNNTQEQTWC